MGMRPGYCKQLVGVIVSSELAQGITRGTSGKCRTYLGVGKQFDPGILRRSEPEPNGRTCPYLRQAVISLCKQAVHRKLGQLCPQYYW